MENQAQHAEQAPSPPPAKAAVAIPYFTAELEQLAKLRDDGVISPEDFEAKKKQILGI